ncbi:MAG: hypothetical protein EXS32_01470 [Opitutus sp.]|nr:hypothetical protein [Opitutus sp.]
MTNFPPVSSGFRRLRAVAVLALVISPWSLVVAAVPTASVVAIQPTSTADLILLGRGFDAGLRQGMVCRLTRGATGIAEVLLVDLRPTCSAALILSVAPGQSIHAGDTASIKILKT